MDNSNSIDSESSNLGRYSILKQFPKEIDFGFCAVGQPTSRSIVVQNYSATAKNFTVQVENFEFSPKSGTIAGKSSMAISVSFTPQNASVLISSAIIKSDDCEGQRVLKISAIGKFPYLKVSKKKFNFGELLFGKRAINKLIIKNVSDVGTHFEIEKMQDDDFEDRSFSLDSYKGFIPPKNSFLIKVRYKPMNWDLYSCCHFKLKCQGGNTINLQCSGQAVSQQCRLSCSFANFGEIKLGGSTNRMISIHNDSETHCVYEVLSDNTNVFGVVDSIGIVKPKSYNRIYLTFSPQKTINYYQRLYILVRNHQVMYIDLIGNCYDLLVKPVPLTHKVIRNFRGMPMTNASFEKNGGDEDVETNDSGVLKIKRAFQLQLHNELFLSENTVDNFLKAGPKFFDFGFCDPTSDGNTREITLTNKWDRKMSIFWTGNPGNSSAASRASFTVVPGNYHLEAGETKVFRVIFKPGMRNTYFYQRIQAFAISYQENISEHLRNSTGRMKRTKDFRIGSGSLKKRSMKRSLVKVESGLDETQEEQSSRIPTFEVGFECVGHSFSHGAQPFIPMINVLPKSEVTLSPCGVGQSTFTSIQLVNKTDTPAFFKFQKESSGIFDIYPKYGMINGNKFKIIIIKFTPKEPKLYSKRISCWLNNSSDSLKITLNGYCCKPLLVVRNKGQVFFPPSYTGVFSKQKVAFHNKSRVSLQYNIKVPRKFEEEVFFDPFTALLKPNQTAMVLCSMIPLKKKKYRVKIPVEYWGNETEGDVESTQLEVFGEGGDGSLHISPRRVDFGIVKVNFHRTSKIVVHNRSHITFYVELDVKPVDDNEKFDPNQKKKIKNAFNFDFTEGLIAGNSKVEIGITFEPKYICDLKFKLVVVARENVPRGMIISNSKSLMKEKCFINITAEGKFPVAKIIDIRNSNLSVSTLWEKFKISQVNNKLLSDLNLNENNLKDFDDVADISELETSKKKAIDRFCWDFGYLQNKNKIEPRKVVLTIMNIGGTDLDWSFKFPNDNQVRAEPWADPGEQSEKGAIEKTILERKIFEVRPRQGNLKPNQKQNILLFYSPKMDEEVYDKKGNKEPEHIHELRANFFVQNGQCLYLKFQGRTLAHLQGQMALKRDLFVLPSLPVGMKLPVIIPIEMENVGSSNIKYEINKDQVKHNNKVNGSAKVFDIENVKGGLRSREKNPLYVYFRPAEAKEYNFHLSIRTFDFVNELDTKEIYFKGYGYQGDYVNPIKEEDLGIPTYKYCDNDGEQSKAYFSIEEVDFGEIGKDESESRLILLFNDSKQSKLHFNFLENRIKYKDEITITPESGDLEAGEFTQIKIKLTAKYLPSIYKGELGCRIAWLNIDNEVIKKRAYSKNNAASSRSFQTNKSSDYKGEDQYAGFMQETIFLRIKKRAKIEIEKQSLSKEMRLVMKDRKEIETDNDMIHNLVDSIFVDVLSGEKVQRLISDLQSQHPRLYCQFDTNPPIEVNKRENFTYDNYVSRDENLEGMEEYLEEDRLVEEYNPRGTHSSDRVYQEELSKSNEQQQQDETGGEEQGPTQPVETQEQGETEIQEQEINGEGVEQPVEQVEQQGVEGEEENTREQQGPQDSPFGFAQKFGAKEPTPVPAQQKNLNYIERVEELDESMEDEASNISLTMRQREKESEFENNKHLIIQKQEFREAVEDIFENIFVDIVKDATLGKLEIRDKGGPFKRSIIKIKTLNRLSTPSSSLRPVASRDSLVDQHKRSSSSNFYNPK